MSVCFSCWFCTVSTRIRWWFDSVFSLYDRCIIPQSVCSCRLGCCSDCIGICCTPSRMCCMAKWLEMMCYSTTWLRLCNCLASPVVGRKSREWMGSMKDNQKWDGSKRWDLPQIWYPDIRSKRLTQMDWLCLWCQPDATRLAVQMVRHVNWPNPISSMLKRPLDHCSDHRMDSYMPIEQQTLE